MAPRPCSESFASANANLLKAGAAFLPGIVLLGIAVAANAGFFSAPAALGATLGALVTLTPATAWLKSAASDIREMDRNGCIPAECQGKRSDLMSALNAAMGLAGIAAAAVAASLFTAAIPWLGLALLVAALAAAIAASIAIAKLPGAWAALDECLKRAARARGPLEAGEKASDPWLLRLKPVESGRYAVPVDGTTSVIAEDFIHDTFLRCSRFSVGQWQIRAVASIIAPAGVRVEFTWSLNGKPIGAGSASPDGRQSVLTHVIPASGALEHSIRVDARDASGFTSSKEAVAEVGETATICKAWVALIEPERKSPAVPWSAERLRPAVDAFHGALDEIGRDQPDWRATEAPHDTRHAPR